MKDKKVWCVRCESVDRKSREGKHKVIGPNGIVGYVCDECIEEIDAEIMIHYEVKEDEDTP